MSALRTDRGLKSQVSVGTRSSEENVAPADRTNRWTVAEPAGEKGHIAAQRAEDYVPTGLDITEGGNR